MSSDHEMELNASDNDVFKENDQNPSDANKDSEKEKPANIESSQTVRTSARSERQASDPHSSDKSTSRPRSVTDNYRSRSGNRSPNKERRHFSSSRTQYRNQSSSSTSASSSRRSSGNHSSKGGSSRPTTPYSRDGCLRGDRLNPDPTWSNLDRARAAVEHMAQDINDYPADLNLSIKEEEEQHFFIIDSDWDEFQRLHVTYKIKFICLPEASITEMADTVINIIKSANPEKRTYISASIFNREMVTVGEIAIKGIVNKIAAHIKAPKDNWEKKRFLPESGRMPTAFKVHLTFPTILYYPNCEHIWPEIAAVNQFLKSETLALGAVPMNLHLWVTKDAKEDKRLLETRGCMFQEFVNKTGLGSTLSKQAQKRITIGILKHHAEGVHKPAHSANKSEMPPIPLSKTSGYKMSQANNNNKFVHEHMGAMEAKIITQAQNSDARDNNSSAIDKKIEEMKAFEYNKVLKQLVEKENERKNIINRQNKSEEEARQRAIDELRAEAAEAEAVRQAKKKKREELEQSTAANIDKSDLRKTVDHLKAVNAQTPQVSAPMANQNLTAEGQQQLAEEWKTKALKFRDNMEHVKENYVALNMKHEQLKRDFSKQQTEAENSSKKANEAAKAKIAALEQQFSRDNVSMQYLRSLLEEKTAEINQLTAENKALQDKLNEASHSLKISNELNIALKQQASKKN